MPDLSFDKLQLFLLVVMPGFIAIRVYDLFVTPEKRDLGSLIIDALTYSLINLVVWSWAIIPLNLNDFPKTHWFWYSLLSIIPLVISPALAGWAVYKFRMSRHGTRWFQHPTKTGWDDFINRREECWMLFHFKDGKMVGGFFGMESFASTYPQEPEVYVQEVWRVDETGVFVEKVEGTFGMVIRLSECQRVEFLNVEPK